MSSEWRAACKFPVEQQSCQLASGPQKAVHFFHVFFSPGRIERAEKGLLDDQIVLPGERKEIACYQVEGRGKFFPEPCDKDFRNIYQGNRGKAIFQQPRRFIAIAAAGDEDGDALIF